MNAALQPRNIIAINQKDSFFVTMHVRKLRLLMKKRITRVIMSLYDVYGHASAQEPPANQFMKSHNLVHTFFRLSDLCPGERIRLIEK